MEYIDMQMQTINANNLHRWAMSQKVPANNFKWKKNSYFNERFIKSNDIDSDKGNILEVDVEYRKNLYDLHNDLLFLPERMNIKKCM